jgi:hypothetical protein
MKNAPYILLALFALSCSTSEVINEPTNFKVHAGINHGEIVENTFHYADAINRYNGTRHIFTTQLRMPVLYSIHLFKGEAGSPLVKLNAGFSPGLVFGF